MVKFSIGYSCVICLLFNVPRSQSAGNGDPICTSRFDFEEKLLHKVVRMEHSMEVLQERVTKELNTIKEENAVLKQEISILKDASTNKALEDQKKYQMKLEENQENMTTDFERRMQQIEEKLADVEQGVAEALNISKREKVVFSVQDATGKLVNEVPTFSKVRVNVGGAYDVTTGKFTCNREGIYMFTFLLRSISSQYTFCHIRLNGDFVNYAISDGTFDMGSVTVYLHLLVGDVVDLSNCTNWRSSRYDSSSVSFSGMEI